MNSNGTRLFRTVALLVGPWVKTSENGTVVNTRGAFYKIFSEMIYSLKLNYTVQVSLNKVSGARLPNGTWTGMIGQLERNEMEAFSTPLVQSEAREKIITFSNLVVHNTKVIVGASSPPQSTDLSALVMAFDMYVWIGLLVSLIVLVFISGLDIKTDRDNVRLAVADLHGYYTLMSFFVAALFLEGTPRDPTSIRGRFVYGIWWLVMLVLANGFCGNLRAMMMAPKEVFKVESLEQLAELTDKIQPITWKNTAFQDYFKNPLDV